MDLCLLCGLLTDTIGRYHWSTAMWTILQTSYYMWTYDYYVDYWHHCEVSLVHSNADYFCGLVTICGLMTTLWTIDTAPLGGVISPLQCRLFCGLVTICGLLTPLRGVISPLQCRLLCRLVTICGIMPSMWTIDRHHREVSLVHCNADYSAD